MEIKKGQLIALTDGAYSDYALRGHMRALKDFESNAEKRRFMEDGDYLAPPYYDPKGEPDKHGSIDRFVAWAIREELIEPIDPDSVVELWLGEYQQLEEA